MSAHVEAVKASADIVEVVAAHTALRRFGSRWKGLCPFCDNTGPNFLVSAENKVYHCFGCGKGGDVVSFVMETQGINFTSAIESLSADYPPRCDDRNDLDRLLSLLDECRALAEKKNKDYGRTGDPFANVKASGEFGVPPWVGAMIRLNDKVRRLQALANGSPLANEGARDSFMDIAVYALIACVLYEDHVE